MTPAPRKRKTISRQNDRLRALRWPRCLALSSTR
nr:MAG TPA: hypothetical protein [Caudoviricetes sp.]